jgi:tetratricopeptide (TPR) repeat protein
MNSPHLTATATAAAPPAGRLSRAALALVLTVMLVRPFLAETPIRQSALTMTSPVSPAGPTRAGADTRNDLSRVLLAWAVLLAGLLWAVDAARRRDMTVRHPWLLWPMAGFAVLGLLSALGASDRRAALTAWFEQASLLGAMLLAAQLLRGRRGLVLAAVLLTGLAGALAAKGAYQVLAEHPQRVADFEAHRAQRLEAFGWQEGSPQARLFEARLRDWSATGFLTLANVFGSLMLIVTLGAAGLAGWKLHLAWQDRRRGGPRKATDLHAPSWSAGLTVIFAAAAGAALLASRSRGAIVAAAAALAAAVAVFLLRRALARRWKPVLAVTGIVAVLLGAGVVAFGLARGYLPTKTMTFRWHYWVGAGRIIAERPLLGTGGANFGSAYLAHRLPRAEEAVKMPHNLAAHALAEYGLAGGSCYLAALAAALVLMCRPGAQPDESEPPATRQRRRGVALLMAVGCVAVAGARALLADIPAVPAVWLLEAAMPAAVLGAALALAWWACPVADGEGPAAAWLRIAVGAGLAGFVLHNLVEDSLWFPGAAVVFYVTAGAALGAAPSAAALRLAAARWLVAALTLAAALGAAWYLVRPVWRATAWTERMVTDLQRGRSAAAAEAAVRAALADPLNPTLAADAAKLLAGSCPREDLGQTRPSLERAREWAIAAHRRDRLDYFAARLAARLDLQATAPDAFRYGWDFSPAAAVSVEGQAMDALAVDPDDPVAMSDLAWAAGVRGQWDQAAGRLEQAVAQDPTSFTLRQHLGQSLFLAGQVEQAEQVWREAAKRVPPHDYDGPLDLMRLSATKLNPKDARLRMDFTRMLLQVNRSPGARAQLRQALLIDAQLPAPSPQRLSLGELAELEMLGAWAEALGYGPGRQPAAGPAAQ